MNLDHNITLSQFKLVHIKRDRNGAAHELAQMEKRLNHSAVWRNCFPVCIEYQIAQDCNDPLSN